MTQPQRQLNVVLCHPTAPHSRAGRGVLTAERAPDDELLLPNPEPLLLNLARSVFEAMAGSREVEQMARWLSPEVFSKLLAHVQHSARARRRHGAPAQRPYIATRSCVWQSPRAGVVEAAVVVDLGQRARAVAIRLEAYRGRWRAERINVL